MDDSNVVPPITTTEMLPNSTTAPELSPINARLLAIKQWRASIVDRYYETTKDKEFLTPGERVIKTSQGIDRLYVAPPWGDKQTATRPMAISQSRQYKKGEQRTKGNPSARQWRKMTRWSHAYGKKERKALPASDDY